jgi:hypothetical protein
LPDSTGAPSKSLDAKDTSGNSSKSLYTVDTSDKSPDTVDDVLPDSTKGRVMGLPNLKDSDRSSHLNNGDRLSPFEKPGCKSPQVSQIMDFMTKKDMSLHQIATCQEALCDFLRQFAEYCDMS